MFGIGLAELVVIGIVGILVFGSRLPEVARTLGILIKKSRKLLRDIQYDIEDSVYSEPPEKKFQIKEKK